MIINDGKEIVAMSSTKNRNRYDDEDNNNNKDTSSDCNRQWRSTTIIKQ
jgi:hypothetical protein